MQAQITLGEAIRLLDIYMPNLDEITDEELEAIEQEALEKWSVEHNAHLHLSQEQKAQYEENRALVSESIAAIKQYRNGELYLPPKLRPGFKLPPNHLDEATLREEAYASQTTLRNLWELIARKRFKRKKLKLKVTEGTSVKEALMTDLRDDIPTGAIVSTFSVFYLVVLLGIIGLFFKNKQPFYDIYMGSLGLFWLVQFGACLLGVLPLARYWLPTYMLGIVSFFINIGVNLYNHVRSQRNVLLGLLFGLPGLLTTAFKYLILYPLYILVGEILASRQIGSVKTRVDYYANIEEAYAKVLIEEDPLQLNFDDLQVLSHLHTQLKDVEQITYQVPSPKKTINFKPILKYTSAMVLVGGLIVAIFMGARYYFTNNPGLQITEESIWAKTLQKDDLPGYQAYLQKYPTGAHAQEAILISSLINSNLCTRYSDQAFFENIRLEIKGTTVTGTMYGKVYQSGVTWQGKFRGIRKGLALDLTYIATVNGEEKAANRRYSIQTNGLFDQIYQKLHPKTNCN